MRKSIIMMALALISTFSYAINIEALITPELKNKNIYDKVNGKLIGEIKMMVTPIECIINNQYLIDLMVGCMPHHFMTIKNHNYPILSRELVEDEYRFVSFEKTIENKGNTWVSIPFKESNVYLKIEKQEVVLFQDLIFTLEDMEYICLEQDSMCQMNDDNFKKELEIVASAITCYDIPYLIKGIIFFQDKPYYQVYLDEEALKLQNVQTSIPLNGFVPVYNSKGKQQGTFFSRGC